MRPPSSSSDDRVHPIDQDLGREKANNSEATATLLDHARSIAVEVG